MDSVAMSPIVEPRLVAGAIKSRRMPRLPRASRRDSDRISQTQGQSEPVQLAHSPRVHRALFFDHLVPGDARVRYQHQIFLSARFAALAMA